MNWVRTNRLPGDKITLTQLATFLFKIEEMPFEVVDMDAWRIDKVLVRKIEQA